MNKEQRIKAVGDLDADLGEILDAVPRNKKGAVFQQASRVEIAAKFGLVAIWLLSWLWPRVNDGFDPKGEEASAINELLAHYPDADPTQPSGDVPAGG